MCVIYLCFCVFFSEQEHRGFHYTPRYYDPEKEERKRLFGQVDGSVDRDKEKGEYVPGSYLHGAFRDGNYATRRSHSTKAQKYIAIVGLVLVAVVLIYITKFYALL